MAWSVCSCVRSLWLTACSCNSSSSACSDAMGSGHWPLKLDFGKLRLGNVCWGGGGAGDALSGRVDAPGGLDVTDCSVALTDGNTGCIDHCGRVSACWPLQHRSKVNTRCTREERWYTQITVTCWLGVAANLQTTLLPLHTHVGCCVHIPVGE
jgi:hypothetical protein